MCYAVAVEYTFTQLKEKAICKVQILKIGVAGRTGRRVSRSAQPWVLGRAVWVPLTSTYPLTYMRWIRPLPKGVTVRMDRW